MKVPTRELAGAALDYAVHVAKGNSMASCDYWLEKYDDEDRRDLCEDYSSNWALAGPIIAQERINLQFCRDLRDRNGLYIHAEMATHQHHGYWRGDHDQPLIAAMRCFVESKLGPVFDLPDELLPPAPKNAGPAL